MGLYINNILYLFGSYLVNCRQIFYSVISFCVSFKPRNLYYINVIQYMLQSCVLCLLINYININAEWSPSSVYITLTCWNFVLRQENFEHV